MLVYKGRNHDYWRKVFLILLLNKPTAHQDSDEIDCRAVEAYNVRPYATCKHGLGIGVLVGAESSGNIGLNGHFFSGQEKQVKKA